jgi:membrane-associated protease RseP (regulator of RpoE activity)
LIGINTAIFSQTGGYQGVGFAVSTSMSKPIYESLVKTGKVVRGFMGIGIQDLNQELAKSFNVKGNHGAIVTDVKEEGPADKAGLKQGDVIVSYQGTAIEDAVTLQRAVTRSSVGSKATVTVMRDGHEKDLSVTIGELPDNPQVAKAEAVPSEQPLAGLAVQELDRETAQELGTQRQHSRRRRHDRRSRERRGARRVNAGRRDPGDQPQTSHLDEGFRSGRIGPQERDKRCWCWSIGRGASLYTSAPTI